MGIDGPLFIGFDTHALSAPAFDTALEVRSANGIDTCIAPRGESTPTPAVSHAMQRHNRARTTGRTITSKDCHTMPTLSPDQLNAMHAWWRAANYLSVGQIYLRDNPLLEAPLTLEHIKPRLLGHWGTTPGLNFLYVHLNRLIKAHDLDMINVIGPGHGGPGLVASTYLEGTYTETYPQITRDRAGLRRLFRQFSWPYGIPSHVAPETPGSIHEGGELGYSLAHAYGAAFDNPELIVACVMTSQEGQQIERQSWRVVT